MYNPRFEKRVCIQCGMMKEVRFLKLIDGFYSCPPGEHNKHVNKEQKD